MTRSVVGPQAVHAGATQPYADVEAYRKRFCGDARPVRWYAGLAERRGGPVLELGCGEGRVLRAMAGAGVVCEGVDRAEPMVEAAKRRGSVAHVGDLRDVRLGCRFRGVVLAFHVVNHLNTRREFADLLATVRAHVGESGWFAFDFRWEPDLRPGTSSRRGRTSRGGRRVGFVEQRIVDGFSGLELTHVVVDGESDGVPLVHRLWQPDDIENQLGCAGFSGLDWSSDYSETPLHDETRTICVVSR